LRDQAINTRFSVGVTITEPVQAAIEQATCWIDVLDADGDLRDGAETCEITGLLPADRGYEGKPETFTLPIKKPRTPRKDVTDAFALSHSSELARHDSGRRRIAPKFQNLAESVTSLAYCCSEPTLWAPLRNVNERHCMG